MNPEFCEIGSSEELMLKAAEILCETFNSLENNHWPDLESSLKEVRECCAAPNICIGICERGETAWLGWSAADVCQNMGAAPACCEFAPSEWRSRATAGS